jgi:hypothetical protein
MKTDRLTDQEATALLGGLTAEQIQGAPEITEAMIDTGVAQFHARLSDDEDYPLSREAELREIISSIFRSMEAVRPELRKKAT